MGLPSAHSLATNTARTERPRGCPGRWGTRAWHTRSRTPPRRAPSPPSPRPRARSRRTLLGPTLGHDELIWVDHQQGTIKRQMAACCKPPHPIRCPLVWGTDLGIIGLQHECEPVPPSVATPEVNEGLVHMQHRRSGCDENSDLVGNISPTLAALQAQRTRPSRQNDLLQLPPPLRCTFRFADINEESQLEQRALQPMQL
mmetsp:Transcript_177417/g.568936  ORF Transcript_177417/g.568936 Transcript_177417/m.568936 type:complete len:200 (-) Transcript_177417:499-1098(-)